MKYDKTQLTVLLISTVIVTALFTIMITTQGFNAWL